MDQSHLVDGNGRALTGPLAPTTKLLGNDWSSSIVSDVDVLVIRVGD